MSEVYVWPEGQVWLWTGSHTASGAPLAYATECSVQAAYPFQSEASLAGTYRPHRAGQRAEVTLGTLYAHDARVKTLFQATAATHCKVMQSGVAGSGGWLATSGRIVSLSEQGSEGRPFTYRVQYVAHEWTGW